MNEIQDTISTNKATILAALQQAGVTQRARLSYSGEDDSGSLWDTTYEPPADPTVVRSIEVDFIEDHYRWISEQKPNELVTKQRRLRLDDALEAMLWQLVDQHNSGWENNSGGGGELVIDVISQELKLEHYDRFVEEHYSHYTY
jgi:hypothetical protein